MTKAIELSCEQYVGVLADATPGLAGGGGASSVVAAIGTALGSMVGSLTVTNKKYADKVEQVTALNEKARDLEARLLALVARDSEVFLPLQAAYAMPTSTEEEKAAKLAAKEEALKGACRVPLDIMACCCEAIDLHAEYVECGSKLAISDVGCGVAFCQAALRAASLNVYINTNSMKNRELAEGFNKEARDMLDKYVPKAEEVYKRTEDYFMKK